MLRLWLQTIITLSVLLRKLYEVLFNNPLDTLPKFSN